MLLKDSTGVPIFFPMVPLKKPRTELGCQPVAFTSSFKLTPLGRFSRSRITCCRPRAAIGESHPQRKRRLRAVLLHRSLVDAAVLFDHFMKPGLQKMATDRMSLPPAPQASHVPAKRFLTIKETSDYFVASLALFTAHGRGRRIVQLPQWTRYEDPDAASATKTVTLGSSAASPG